MASKIEFVRSKTVMTYDTDEIKKLIKDAKVAHCMLTDPPPVVDEESVMNRLSDLTLGTGSGITCSCCGVGPFTSRAQQTAHYKHHWHTHNLKRKLFGKQSITLGEYNARQDDSSNVSGSESEGEDNPNTPATQLFAAATRHCKAFYSNPKGQVFCIYRCLLHHRKEEMSLDGEGHVWAHRIKELLSPAYFRMAVVMVSGGHFAGCIFVGGSDSIHKTLHSYTTRRSQGQAQSARDQTGNAPRSAGASLRRYNQDQFTVPGKLPKSAGVLLKRYKYNKEEFLMHVQNILVGWNDELKECGLIFYRAVGAVNQAALFGKPSPLRREDPRVRQLPFPTRKPTFKEVKRVFHTLASIEVYDSLEHFQKALLALTGGKIPAKIPATPSDTSIAEQARKVQKPPQKTIDRAKSRERPPRELPTQVTSSEDEGPCYIDSETPAGWIKTLSEQSVNGVITNSRKDLLNDCSLVSCPESESEKEVPGVKDKCKKKKKNKKPEEKQPLVKKQPPKVPNSVKKMWKAIMDKEETSLDPILEAFEGDLEAAYNTQDPADGNTALHKAAIAEKPGLVTQILTAGGDPCIKNHALQTPYAASPHADTRVAFRMFQAQFPDKYNYSKSQIPGPITAEQLEQEKEKKAQQKRAKRQREKEKQIDKLKANKFLMLTDAQKKKNFENRCFLCGSQLPKIPFEYDDCKFCQIPCLHSHRKVRPLNMSV